MKQLEKEILEEWAKNNGWNSFKEFAENRQGITNPKEIIQLTQSKIIERIDKRIENLKKNDTFYKAYWGSDFYPEKAIIQELQSLKKDLLESEKEDKLVRLNLPTDSSSVNSKGEKV